MRCPAGLSDAVLQKMLESRKHWYFQKTEEVAQHRLLAGRIPGFAQLPPVLRVRIKAHFAERVAYFAEQMQVTYGQITIRSQKTRWGSCSAKGNLNFNYRLYFMPGNLLDYVVVHELSHRVHMNHSPEFWKTVETYCPEYRQYRQELKSMSTID